MISTMTSQLENGGASMGPMETLASSVEKVLFAVV